MSDLVEQIDALLELNAKGAVSHPIPGLAVELLERSRAALTVAFASRPSQGGEWVMVPREPTDEMLAAGSMRTGEQYRAMLTASPSPYGVEELVERAFKDGLAYGSNVEGADPETAWMQSRVRASLGRLALKNQESDRG